MPDTSRATAVAHRLDAAAFDALLERAAERAVSAPADDTAGLRVVARLRDRRVRPHAALRWAPAAVVAGVLLALWLPTRVAERPPAAARTDGAAVHAGVATPAPTDDRAAAAHDAVPPATPPRLAAAPRAAVPAARRRGRSRAAAPPADDDPSTVPLLVVMGALRLGGADDAGDPLAPAPLPVDALALESLDPAPLEPWQD